jgi:hypothetical protein
MPKNVEKEVKSQGKAVGVAKYQEPTSVAEALKMFGEDKALSMILYRLAVQEMDKIRLSVTGTGLPKEVAAAIRKDPGLMELIKKEMAKRAAAAAVAPKV